jgi:hypothetical protein
LQRRDSEISDANLDAKDNIEKFVVDFVNAHVPQTLKTADVDLSPGKSTVKADVLNSAVSVDSLNRGVYIHAVRDQRIVRISAVEFRKWLTKERRIAPHEIIKNSKTTRRCSTSRHPSGAAQVSSERPNGCWSSTSPRCPASTCSRRAP